MAYATAVIVFLCLTVRVLSAPVEERRQKRSDDPSPLETVVENLSQQVASLTAKYNAQQAQLVNRQCNRHHHKIYTRANFRRQATMAYSGVVVMFLCLTIGVSSEPLDSEERREKRSDDPSPLETVVENLSQQVASLTAKYNAQQAQL
ncbi:hypothetical protein BaRGS_00026859, partial [Batillaria attramentaria]